LIKKSGSATLTARILGVQHMIVLGTYDFIKIQQMCYAANSTSYDWQIIDFKSDLQHDI